jgi:predicted acetyltransferase
MGELVLRQLELGDEHDVDAAVAELAAEGLSWTYRSRDGLSWPAYVDRVHAWERGLELPEGFVPHADLVAVVDGEVVGRASVRFELNDYLTRLGGHVGYVVRPPFRRRGHATEILRQALVRARDRGIDPVLVTCDADNLGSRRVIEANGGRLDAVVPQGGGLPPKRRYWC